MKRLLPVLLVLALAACGQKPEEAAAPAAPAPVAEAPAVEPAPAPAAEPAPTDAATPDGGEADTVPATDADAAAPDSATVADAAPAAETPAPAADERPAPPVVDPATAPRAGIDYRVLPTPQPTFATGGIEIAEVFAYTCIHCANLQPNLSLWKGSLPADVRVQYVPGAFGGVSDNFARGFFAAEAMGLLDKTHDGTFAAHFVEQKFATGSIEEIADYYASQGADRDAFLEMMNSFAITSKVNRARQFALRTGVSSTPTFIVNGKYAANVTGDRGPEGLFDTLEFLAAHERAGTTP